MTRGAEEYSYVPHQWGRGFYIAGKPFCPRCGLIALNNEFSAWAVDKGCNHAEHPQFQSKVKKHGRKL